MKHIYILFSFLCSISISTFAQNLNNTNVPQIDRGNCREGEDVEFCLTHKKQVQLQEKLKQNQKSINSVTQEEKELDSVLQLVKTGAIPKGVVYKIPIVFHVLHNGGVENISRAQIMDALAILNRDYRALNSDKNDVVVNFKNLVADVEVEFVLATKAPNGACFGGITRTISSFSYNGTNGQDQVDAIINGNDVYQGEWPGDEYLNVFICGDLAQGAGYTYQPSNYFGGSMYNGIWILHEYVGSIGTSSELHSRALTHECGHWLDLDHTWGGTNNPGCTGGSNDPNDPCYGVDNCDYDDGVNDTPNTIGINYCNLNENSCGVLANVENYMDYSYCSKMFTLGQKNKMIAALNSSVGRRNRIWQTSNLNATGATGAGQLCNADFSVSKSILCIGETITFEDESYNGVTSWDWSFEGGTPSTSIESNPIVTYSTPGWYNVTLTVSNGSSSLTETKTEMIYVSEKNNLPFYEGFENMSTFNGDNLLHNTEGNVIDFNLYSANGYSSNKSLKLANSTISDLSKNAIESSAIDLSGLTSSDKVTLTFKYAYRKKKSTDYEYLRVYASKDCGETWSSRTTFSNNNLSSLTTSSNWAPTSDNDWTTVHVKNITSTFFVDNFRFKIELENDGGNNLYLDDINLYEGDASETIVSGIEEIGDINYLSIYPNPSNGNVTIQFENQNGNKNVDIFIRDLRGQVLDSYSIMAIEGNNLVLIGRNEISSGLYFVELRVGSQKIVKQLIFK
jgi:PKD repeat protein